jgi:hypothetical protein
MLFNPMQIDRGNYPDAVTPWEDPGWRAAALTWLDRELSGLGLRETGPRRVRLRPWSVIIRVEADRPVWFKANPPGSRFEAALTEALSRWTPGHVLTPYAIDAERGWSLLPDGGEMLRNLPAEPRHWAEVLTQYADLQRSLVSHTDELLGLGVPDARVAELPGIFDKTIAGNQTLGAADRERLQRFRPRLVEWCEELAGIGVPDSLDHADLHGGQILVGRGRFTFFDWGDANVSHPFCSLLVAAEHAGEQHGADIIPRLRDAYLEPWTGDHSVSELRRAAGLAWRLGQLGRAGSWGRLFPDAYPGSIPVGDAERAAALLRLMGS